MKIPTWPVRGFVLDGRKYIDIGIGEWTGFYDWLRDIKGNLLGVRYWLNEETETLSRQPRQFDYLRVDGTRFIEIYFSDSRQVEPKLSADQDFLYDPVFRSDDGEYALGFALDGLGLTELRNIDGAQADWGTFQPLPPG
jgi:hypothetical protein